MEALELLDAASMTAIFVKVLKQALADAWAAIAFTTRPDLAQSTRLSLAHAIVAQAGCGPIERTRADGRLRRHSETSPQASQLGETCSLRAALLSGATTV